MEYLLELLKNGYVWFGAIYMVLVFLCEVFQAPWSNMKRYQICKIFVERLEKV